MSHPIRSARSFLCRRSSAGVALLALVATGCGDLGFSTSVTNREPFTPPPIYATWWSATEVCSGRSGNLGSIEWYLATGITGDGLVARGRWTAPHEIILVRGYEDDERTVRHEMLHDLLAGDSDHTSMLWTACDLRFD